MAGVTVDSVIVSIEARVAKYQADLATATKQTEDAFKRMRAAAKEPITPKVGAAASVNAEAAAVEKAEARKQTARRKTAETEAQAQDRIAKVIQRTIERDNAATAQAERNAGRRSVAYNKGLAAAQTRAMSGTSLGAGNVAPGQSVGGSVAKQIALESRLAEAKAGGAVKTARALQDQLEKLRLIERYQRLGLSATDAQAKAESRLTSIVSARARKEEQAARASLEASLRQNLSGVGAGIKGAAAGIIGGIGVAEISALNDKYIEFTNRLKLAGLEGQNQKDVQDALFSSAQRYGVELGSLGGIFQKATEAGRQYGATQEQNLKFTNAIAAAVKVQGGSVVSARGAILQLGQSLQSGTVRAEEFNSLMEGLFPLLQAAAGASDKYGGSVAKLRAAVIDGKLSSEEFFNLILKGSDILEKKAANATLTTAAGFTTLTNALTVYFGEADKANGVSAALGAALGKLADNLDIIIPAIAAVGLALGVGFVTNAIAAATAGATLATAMTSLLSILGGPVGIAITAVTLGLGYLAVQSRKTAGDVQVLTKQQAALQQVMDASKTDAMAASTGGLTNARSKLTAETIRLAKAEAYLNAQQAERQLNLAKAGLKEVTTTVRGRKVTTTEQLDTHTTRGGSEASRALRTANDALVAAGRQVNAVRGAEREIGKAVTRAGISSPSESAADKRKREAAARKAQRAAEKAEREQDRDESQDRQMQLEVLRARSALTDNVEERANFELQMLAIEKAQRVADIANDKTLSNTERAARLKRIETLYGPVNSDPNAISVGAGGLLQRGVDRETQKQIDQDAADIADRLNSVEQERLRGELDAAVTRQDRARIQSQLLDLEIKERDAALAREQEQARLAGKADTVAAIQSQRDALAGVQATGQAAIDKENAGPLDQYRARIGQLDVAGQIETYLVDELQSVQDSISSALTKSLGIKNDFIGNLISLFVQQNIIRPLLESLSSQGGGGILGAIGGAIGLRASGGNVVKGQPYIVGENGREMFVPATSGKIVPSGRMNGAGGSNTTIVQSFTLDARGGVTTPQLIDYINKTARTQAVTAASAVGQTVFQSIPQRLNEFNRDGV